MWLHASVYTVQFCCTNFICKLILIYVKCQFTHNEQAGSPNLLFNWTQTYCTSLCLFRHAPRTPLGIIFSRPFFAKNRTNNDTHATLIIRPPSSQGRERERKKSLLQPPPESGRGFKPLQLHSSKTPQYSNYTHFWIHESTIYNYRNKI